MSDDDDRAYLEWFAALREDPADRDRQRAARCRELEPVRHQQPAERREQADGP